jgi:hypothetical protein
MPEDTLPVSGGDSAINISKKCKKRLVFDWGSIHEHFARHYRIRIERIRDRHPSRRIELRNFARSHSSLQSRGHPKKYRNRTYKSELVHDTCPFYRIVTAKLRGNE